ncbi:MAG: hypothetical protein J0H91_22650 [Rhodospirillales bacterium]|nr:hypothetical protein [Rhodospirillales bacterium]
MTGLFHRLGARALGQLPVLQPRRPGLFEPDAVVPDGLPPAIEATAAGDVWHGAATASAVLGASVSQTPPVAATVVPDAGPAAAPARRAAQAERAGAPLLTLADMPPASPRPPASIRMADAAAPRQTGPASPRAAPPPAARLHMAPAHPARMVFADGAGPPAAAGHAGGAHPAAAARWSAPTTGTHDPSPPAADRPSVAPGASQSGRSAFGAPQTDGVAAARPGDAARPGIGAASAGAKAAPPAVEVTIGRVEIRFAPPAAPAPASARQVGPPPLDVLLGRGGAR